MDNQNTDNVWIDREEYDRLKSIESQQSSQHAQPQQQEAQSLEHPTFKEIAAAQTPSTEEQPATDSRSMSQLTILTGVFAVVSFIFPPAILIFLILGIMTLVRFFNSKSSKTSKLGVGIVLTAGITIILTIAGPFILFFGFVIMWQIGCWTGLGSCTSV